jgi:ligand-binding SRPBCC domain-containing protein
MARAEASGIAHATPEAVFDFLVDLKNLPAWSRVSKSVEQLTPDPVADGTRYRGRFRSMGTVEWVLADSNKPTGFSYTASSGMGTTRHSWKFSPDGDKTRFSNAIDVKPKGFGILLAPLTKMMVASRAREVVIEVQAHFKQGGS